ncbi:MAG: GIY-YIG nuclease family protein [Chloroflexota bacterium]
MPEKQYYVYIMTNTYNTILYTGMTNNLERRVLEHRSGVGSKFTSKYNLHKLVYYEYGSNVEEVIAREKQIKAGSRRKKKELVEEMNPNWNDLNDDFFE